MLESRQNSQALLIDLDGVLRLWPRSDARLELAHDLPAGAIRRVAFEPALIEDVITGRISDNTWRQCFVATLSQRHPRARVVEAVAAWSTPNGTVNLPVLKLVRQVREQAAVILVTNATDRLNRDLAALGLLDQFDSIINSSEVGVAKPDAGIYEVALRAAGVASDRAVFVDDQQQNVAAATCLGMQAHRFVDVDALAAFLRRVGLLSSNA